MHSTTSKIVISVAWILSICTIGVLWPVTTTLGWLLIGSFGTLPVVLMLRAWRRPQQSMAQSIAAQTRSGRGW